MNRGSFRGADPEGRLEGKALRHVEPRSPGGVADVAARALPAAAVGERRAR